MNKLLILALLSIPAHAWAQTPAGPGACPQIHHTSHQHQASVDRGRMLADNSSGWVQFSLASDVGGAYVIKRLNGPGDIQWQVSRRSNAGGSWTWTKRWGLPAIATGSVSNDEKSMVSSIMGPNIQGGLQRLWDRILANPGIAIDHQGSSATPVLIEDIGAVTHYQGWTHGRTPGPPLFAKQVSITSRSSSAAAPVVIHVHKAVLAHPGAMPGGWPIANP